MQNNLEQTNDKFCKIHSKIKIYISNRYFWELQYCYEIVIYINKSCFKNEIKLAKDLSYATTFLNDIVPMIAKIFPTNDNFFLYLFSHWTRKLPIMICG